MLRALWRLFILPSQTRRRQRQKQRRIYELNDHVLRDMGLEPRNHPSFRPPMDPNNWR